MTLLAAACTGPIASSSPSSTTGGPSAGAVASPSQVASPAASPAPATPTAAPPAVPTHGTWARITVDGPAPAAREDHTWTVGDDGRIWLYGGRDGATVFDDLWVYDPVATTWASVGPAGAAPAARFGHEAVWAPGIGLVVWAGQAGPTFFDDLWRYDPDAGTWQELPGDGARPIPRYGSCSGIGPDGRLWISHGFTADGARFADTAAYDFETGAWTSQSPLGGGPVERCLHTCWWTAGGQLALYGGQTTGVAALGDLWHLAPSAQGGGTNTWTQADAAGPVARHLPAVARLGAITVVVGGRDVDRSPLADAWLLPDGGPFAELQVDGNGPQARSGATLVHDAARGRLLLLGGIAGNALADLWELTLR